MCGIAGCSIVGLSESEIRSTARCFVDALHHRGPDGNGVWQECDNLLFTHNRLAILDLSENGRQPMTSGSGRYVLTFNGEIYNFLKLRSALEKEGYSFKGRSDTEVMLGLFDRYGVQISLGMIDGMFALASFDRKTGELIIARDRMGEKPLFYGWMSGRFVFASELKAFQLLEQPLEINSGCINDLLSFGYIPTPHSIYQNIYKLSPGSSLTLTKDSSYERPDGFSPYPESGQGPVRFWDLNNVKETELTDQFICPNQAVKCLEETLNDTISRQLVADVPVGSFLSGGIDSSLVTALAQNQASLPIQTFTVGFDTDQFNEAPFASKIASHLGTQHNETYVKTGDVLDLVMDIPKIYDEPFADPSQLPSTLVAKVARQEVTVCLSGDGGDELFAGYNRYTAASKSIDAMKSWPKFGRIGVGRFLMSINPTTIDRALAKLHSLPGLGRIKQANIGIKLKKLGKVMTITDEHEIYIFLLKFNGLESGFESTKTLLEERVARLFQTKEDFITTAMLVDQLNYLVDDNLQKVDRSAMSASLETRLPLLDRQVVELSWRIPSHIKLKDSISKWPLRELLYKHVPRGLVERPKMGFSVPIASWLRNELKEWSSELLKNKELIPLLNVDHYWSLWNKHQNRTGDNALALWPVLVLSQWLEYNSRASLV